MASGTPLPSAPGMSPTPGWPQPWASPPPSKETDLAALSSMKLSMIIAIVSSSFGFVIQGASAAGYPIVSVPATGTGLSINSTTLSLIFGLSIVGTVLTLVSLYFLRTGFLRLRAADPRFQAAPTWTLLLMIGFVVLSLALFLLLDGLLQFLHCVGGASVVPPGCIPGTLLGGLGLIVVAGIILLIGGIGTIINLWRLGDRYDNILFKIGAVIFIFFQPLGAILTLIGVSQAEGSVRAGPMQGYSPTMVSPPMPPPPPPPPPPMG